MNTTAEQLCQLFAGNPTALGTEEGGCERIDPAEFTDRVAAHFEGWTDPIGVYPLAREIISMGGQGHLPGEWTVHWGCVDYDEGDADSLIHARNTIAVLDRFGITGWVEKSRSKGYHVWVFLADWTTARLVRDALLAAAQIADAPTREINPKQYQLAEGQLGNYVRLPYPGGDVMGPWAPRSMLRREFDGTPFSVATFAELAHASRCNGSQLEPLAALYVPPVQIVKVEPSREVVRGRPAERRLSGLAFKMWRDGPLSGTDDRSAWLWSMARELAKSPDLSYSECLSFLFEAHDQHAPKWGHTPDNGRANLERLMKKAAGH